MIKVNGTEVKVKLDLGTLKILKKVHGINFFGLDEGGFDVDVMSALFLSAARRAGEELTADELDSMSIGEILEANAWLESTMKDFLPDKTDSPKNKTRQS